MRLLRVRPQRAPRHVRPAQLPPHPEGEVRPERPLTGRPPTCADRAAVRNLGVIDELASSSAPGMTALTGETGAGKTMLVEAHRAARRRPRRPRRRAARRGGGARSRGASSIDDDEVVLRRVVPARRTVTRLRNGRLATVGAACRGGRRLVDLHGQHSHQSLLGAGRRNAPRSTGSRASIWSRCAPRAARVARASMPSSPRSVATNGRGPARSTCCASKSTSSTARTWMIAEEDRGLEAEEDRLADATAHRDAGARAVDALTGDGGALDALGSRARGSRAARRSPSSRRGCMRSRPRPPTSGPSCATWATSIADDPERLAEVRARRQLLRELIRKYGETLARGDRLSRRGPRATRRARLARRSGRRARVAAGCRARRCRTRGATSGAPRVGAAPARVRGARSHLLELALPKAQRRDRRRRESGDTVTLPVRRQPRRRPARRSPGRLGWRAGAHDARVRLVAHRSAADAGVRRGRRRHRRAGGALAVGRSPRQPGATHQVLVVTHLAEVAAYADAQIAIDKREAKVAHDG